MHLASKRSRSGSACESISRVKQPWRTGLLRADGALRLRQHALNAERSEAACREAIEQSCGIQPGPERRTDYRRSPFRCLDALKRLLCHESAQFMVGKENISNNDANGRSRAARAT